MTLKILRRLAWCGSVAWLAISSVAQQNSIPSGALHELWVDPLRGSDVAGDGSPHAPFRSMWRASSESMAANLQFGGIVPADLDGDGDRDLLIVRSSLPPRVFENVGSSSIPIYVFRGEIPLIEPIGLSHQRAVDIDGDGDEDLVFLRFPFNYQATQVDFVENLGGMPPVFTPPQSLLGSGGGPMTLREAPAEGISVGDLDADGLWDIVSFELEYAPGGCANVRYLRGWLYKNVGTVASPRFAVGTPLSSPMGSLYFPDCSSGSCVIYDIDRDGYADLFYSDEDEIFWCRGRGPFGLDDPVRVAAPHISRAVDLRFVEPRGTRGELWLIAGDRKNIPVSGDGIHSRFYARRVLLNSSGPGSVGLSDPLPYTLMGEIGPPPGHVVFHLAPGRYSSASGEVFPWNLFYGASLVGSPGTEIDAGNENVLHMMDIGALARYFRTQRVPPVLIPSWGSGVLEISDVSMRTTALAIYLWQYGQLRLRNVAVEGAEVAVLLGNRRLAEGALDSDARIENCRFTNCQVGVQAGSYALWKNVELRGCSFENCSVTGVYATDRGTWRLSNNRFLGNRRGLHVEAYRTCGGPCANDLRLNVELYGNHFADNVEHYSVLSLSSAGSNQYINSWHDTVVGGGMGFNSPASGTEFAEIRVRNAVVYPGGVFASSNFATLDIGASSVSDPILATQNGNISIAPDFALSPREGHLVSSSLLEATAQLAAPAASRLDADGDERGLGLGRELGADEIRIPALIGERFAARGGVWTLGVVGPPSAWALVMLAAERQAPIAAFGSLLWLDPASSATVLLPVAIDSRGVSAILMSVPNFPTYPSSGLWAQGLVGSAAGMALTPPRRVALF